MANLTPVQVETILNNTSREDLTKSIPLEGMRNLYLVLTKTTPPPHLNTSETLANELKEIALRRVNRVPDTIELIDQASSAKESVIAPKIATSVARLILAPSPKGVGAVAKDVDTYFIEKEMHLFDFLNPNWPRVVDESIDIIVQKMKLSLNGDFGNAVFKYLEDSSPYNVSVVNHGSHLSVGLDPTTYQFVEVFTPNFHVNLNLCNDSKSLMANKRVVLSLTPQGFVQEWHEYDLMKQEELPASKLETTLVPTDRFKNGDSPIEIKRLKRLYVQQTVTNLEDFILDLLIQQDVESVEGTIGLLKEQLSALTK
jgi:hypothetical protein